MRIFSRLNKRRIWYMLCFFAFGIIDQRRSSGAGWVQMAAANSTGLVLAAMLLPSLKEKWYCRWQYAAWTTVCMIGGGAACVWGFHNWSCWQQWVTGVLNVAVWGYLIIYILLEWKSLALFQRMKPVFLGCFLGMFAIEFLSPREDLVSLYTLLVFGGFYLIGVGMPQREDFFQGLLDGIILWFFVQQTIAFAFRPYDYVRYRGLYVGETQNGIFYMFVYCAFLCRWIWAKEKGQKKIRVWGYFVLAAGSISFLVFTGGRSSLVGAAVATLLVYAVYDMVWKKSFGKLLLHVMALGACVILTFPVVYGCIRYLPAILHHPVWFEGEYKEERSVRSFDPWYSDRYITLERAVEHNVGRTLKLFGINQDTGKAQATTPGSSTDNQDTSSVQIDSITARKMIYSAYLKSMNLWGHEKRPSGFYFPNGVPMGHAHNMFLEIGYYYGIAAALLLIGISFYSFAGFLRRAVRERSMYPLVCLCFFGAVLFYGQTEMAVLQGMMTWVLIYLLPYFAGTRETL